MAAVAFKPISFGIGIPKDSILPSSSTEAWIHLNFLNRYGLKIIPTAGGVYIKESRNGSRIGNCNARISNDIVFFNSSDDSNPFNNDRDYRLTGPIALTAKGWTLSMLLLLLVATSERLIVSNSIHAQRLVHKLKKTLQFNCSPAELIWAQETSLLASTKHIRELDGVRGYACISVLSAHCLVGIIEPTNDFLYFSKSYLNSLLLAGVDLFFVLSGFLIGGKLIDSKSSSKFFSTFWIRRTARIMPVLAILLASYAIALQINELMHLSQLDLWLLAKPLTPLLNLATFTQSIPMAQGTFEGGKWVGVTWSLAIEEQFYLFFPFLVYFLSRRTLLFAALAVILSAPFFRAICAAEFGNWYASYVLLPTRMDGLMFGVLIAILVRNSHAVIVAKRLQTVLDLIACMLIYAVATNSSIISIWSVPACGPFPPLKQSILGVIGAIVILRIFLNRHDLLNSLWRCNALVNMGVISYGLYMYHQPVNGLVHGFLWNQVCIPVKSNGDSGPTRMLIPVMANAS